MANQVQNAHFKVERPVAQRLLLEERVTEHHHHGPVGGGSQPDGRVTATLLQSGADEEPWVRALRLDEGIGEAPARPHVHGGHVDLNEVMSAGYIIASRWGRRS